MCNICKWNSRSISCICHNFSIRKFNEILCQIPKSEHCLYGDDVHVLTRNNKNLTTINTLEIIEEKNLELGRNQKSCTFIESVYVMRKVAPVQNVQTLNVLGVTSSKEYRWKPHWLHSKNAIETKANFIRCVAWKSLVHLHIVASLSKMPLDYGLIVHDCSNKSNINTLESAHHQVVRAHKGMVTIRVLFE